MVIREAGHGLALFYSGIFPNSEVSIGYLFEY